MNPLLHLGSKRSVTPFQCSYSPNARFQHRSASTWSNFVTKLIFGAFLANSRTLSAVASHADHVIRTAFSSEATTSQPLSPVQGGLTSRESSEAKGDSREKGLAKHRRRKKTMISSFYSLKKSTF